MLVVFISVSNYLVTFPEQAIFYVGLFSLWSWTLQTVQNLADQFQRPKGIQGGEKLQKSSLLS